MYNISEGHKKYPFLQPFIVRMDEKRKNKSIKGGSLW